jgi:short-subunit dehydrogenase
MKTFLSIGSGPGLGYATAERFAKEGFQVVLSARTSTKIRQLADQLEAKGYNADARTVNSADPKSIAALVSDVERNFGSIDVLHYNVAAMRKANITEQPADTFIPDLAMNIGGALLATQAVLPKMLERGSGTILLTGGHYARTPDPEHLSLSIGKAGLRALTLGLFESLKQQGIHIAAVVTSTPMTAGSREAETIGNDFWNLHNQPRDSWTAEVSASA